MSRKYTAQEMREAAFALIRDIDFVNDTVEALVCDAGRMLSQSADELERLRAENARLIGSYTALCSANDMLKAAYNRLNAEFHAVNQDVVQKTRASIILAYIAKEVGTMGEDGEFEPYKTLEAVKAITRKVGASNEHL